MRICQTGLLERLYGYTRTVESDNRLVLNIDVKLDCIVRQSLHLETLYCVTDQRRNAMELRADVRIRMSHEMELAECIKDGRVSVGLSMESDRFKINRDNPSS
jgi:hypothetical protein